MAVLSAALGETLAARARGALPESVAAWVAMRQFSGKRVGVLWAGLIAKRKKGLLFLKKKKQKDLLFFAQLKLRNLAFQPGPAER